MNPPTTMTSEEIYIEYADNKVSLRDFFEPKEYEQAKEKFDKEFGLKKWLSADEAISKDEVEKAIKKYNDVGCSMFDLDGFMKELGLSGEKR